MSKVVRLDVRKRRTSVDKEVKGQAPRQAKSEKNLNGGTNTQASKAKSNGHPRQTQHDHKYTKQARQRHGKIPTGIIQLPAVVDFVLFQVGRDLGPIWCTNESKVGSERDTQCQD